MDEREHAERRASAGGPRHSRHSKQGCFTHMTRENKLALVVGFGLILFVGILISDHFSIVHTQQPANFTKAAIADPLHAVQSGNPNLIELQPIAPPPQPAVSTGTMDINAISAVGETARPEQQTSIYNGALTAGNSPQHNSEVVAINADGSNANPPGFVPVPAVSDPIPAAFAIHNVRGGESLFGICRQHYGDTSLVNALAKFNSLDDPAAIEVGQPIKLPAAELLGGRTAPVTRKKTAPAPANAAPNLPLRIVNETTATAINQNSKPARSKTYTVKSGDSLATIAKRIYGSRDKWRKIYDMNRNVIDDPDDVKAGTILKL
jgi:nucleoid-associated protein YgaU